jgi:pimeloyl-ACP methyl ester carboxylesterase
MKVRLLAAIAALASAPAAAQSADACAKLAAIALPGATVTSTTMVTVGQAIVASVMAPADLCRVTVTAKPTADSDIRIEVWLPSKNNGKFLQVGNGGFAGQIPARVMLLGAAGGYIVAGTDDGHQSTDGTDASWALGHPEKLVDFGTRAVKTTTDIGKAIAAAFLQMTPHKAYFFGCSDGGREALMTAQRHPTDFDGIVAGAPAYDWTGLQGSAALIEQHMAQPGARIPVVKLPAIQAAALKACGGGAFVSDQKACRFDPKVLACDGADTPTCLTALEIATLKMIYRGTRDPATGRKLPGLTPGAEAQPGSWSNWLLGRNSGAGATDKPTGFAANWFAYAVLGNAKATIADLTRTDFVASEKLAPLVSATSPDLSAFRAHGGKLVMYHGWNDPAISPGYSMAYRAAVAKKLGDPSEFYRLWLVPGMLHCGGGAAPSTVDWVGTLANWVEDSKVPEAVTARAATGATQMVMRER